MRRSVPWYDPRIARGMAKQLTCWHERLKAGEKAIGWKIGFGSAAAMEQLQITAPLVGFLTDRALVPSGRLLSLSGWVKPVAEPEIAVYLGKDVPRGASREAAGAAISAIGPAIELADLDRAPDDVEAILAGNIYQRHVVLGARDASRAGCVLDGLVARVTRGGTQIAGTTESGSFTGDPLDIVRHVADLLAAFGERLRAGQLVITGSVVPPLFVEPGEEVVFALEPIGGVSVRFAA
jgi:2-keto-4-pentenoate hydratase